MHEHGHRDAPLPTLILRDRYAPHSESDYTAREKTVNQVKTDAVTLTTLVSGAIPKDSCDMRSKDIAQKITQLDIP